MVIRNQDAFNTMRLSDRLKQLKPNIPPPIRSMPTQTNRNLNLNKIMGKAQAKRNVTMNTPQSSSIVDNLDNVKLPSKKISVPEIQIYKPVPLIS
jgi:hypothetical protein